MGTNSPSVSTPPLVLVEWLDAEHEFGWMDGNQLDDAEPVLTCFTAGWLLKKTKTHLRICQTFSSDNHAQTLVIPSGMVVSMVVVQPAKTRTLK